MIITYIVLLYFQHDKILKLLTIHKIIVIVIILILIIIINAFIFLQTSLAMHEKNSYNTLQLPYLQNEKVTYYDLHVTLLKEFIIHCNYLLTENKQT